MRYVYLSLLILLTFLLNVNAETKALRSRTFVRTLSLSMDDLAKNSGIIFKGTLKSIDYDTVEYQGTDFEVRKMKFKVEDSIKGVNSKTFTAIEWAAFATPFTGEIKKDKSYVFFFNTPSSKTGFTSLRGMEQGYISFNEDGNPEIAARVIDKSRSSLNIDKNLSVSMLGHKSLTQMSDRAPKSYVELKNLIQSLN